MANGMESRMVTLVNRTSKNLTGLWNGRHYTITPGRHEFPLYKAEKFKLQNPLMGSEDPYTLRVDYLLGIEEEGDDTTPLEQSDAIEKWDRSKLPNSKVDVVPGRNGIYSARDVATALPAATNFTKA